MAVGNLECWSTFYEKCYIHNTFTTNSKW